MAMFNDGDTARPSAARIVSDAVLGLDFRTVVVGGKVYKIEPPTIHRLAGAARCLSRVADAASVLDFVTGQKDLSLAAAALSWFICDSEDLADELAFRGTLGEVTEALGVAYSLLSVQDFQRLSILSVNVSKAAARQRQ